MISSALRMLGRAGPSRRIKRRREFFELAASFVPMLAVDTGTGGRFFVRTEDLHIGRSLFVNGGRQELETLELATELIRTSIGRDALVGTTLIDVGANIGTTTVPALLSGTFERALAIEPEADNFSDLRLNVQLNSLESRVVAVRAAASNCEGSTRLLVRPGRSGKHRLHGPRESKRDGVEVSTMTIDALLQREGISPANVGLLWIDAEGSEDRVIAGATAILEARRPIVLELNPLMVERTGGSQDKLEQRLKLHYSHFVPLRSGSPVEAVLRPLEMLPALVEALGKGKKVDVLLLDLEAHHG